MKKLGVSDFVDAMIRGKHRKKARGGNTTDLSKSGLYFESNVLVLKKLGFKVLSSKKFEETPKEELPKRYIACNVPYTNMLRRKAAEWGISYGKGRPRTEFVIHADDAKSTTEFPTDGKPLTIRIECKYQAGEGTAEQKLTHSVLDLHYGPPEKNIILLMDGPGFSPLIHRWVEDICKYRMTWKLAPRASRKLIRKMDTNTFQKFCNKAFA